MWSQIYSDYGDDKYQDPLDIHRFAHLLDFMAKNFKRNRHGIPTWQTNLIAMAIKDHRHVIALVGTKLKDGYHQELKKIKMLKTMFWCFYYGGKY